MLPVIAAHVFSLREDVAFHGVLDVFLGRAGLEIEFGVEREELEVVAVGFAGRRAWTAVADLGKVVAALTRAVGGLFGLREILWERAEIRGKVVEDPMDPSANGRIRIIGDYGKTLRGRRRIAPRERGGDVCAGARELFGNVCTGSEIGAFELQSHSNGTSAKRCGAGVKGDGNGEQENDREEEWFCLHVGIVERRTRELVVGSRKTHAPHATPACGAPRRS